MKNFVMYGAGNIGRGFIGQLFADAGYRVGFVDINKEVIDRLNADRTYPVEVVGNHKATQIVNNVYGIDGTDIKAIATAIAECDLMATAIGVNVLKFIAKPLAMGIKKRYKTSCSQLNIIICENMIGADAFLAKLVKEEIPELSDYVDNKVGFVEASIGRMVPVIPEEVRKDNPLKVFVEPYNYLPIDKDAFKGEMPDVPNLYPFSPFKLFIERKLFMHNMSHALCAYLGYLRGYKYIWQAMSDYDVRYVVIRSLTAMAFSVSKENNSDIKPLIEHGEDLMQRFTNKALGDTVARVGKDTKRKLGENDRLIGALNLANKNGVICNHMCIGIAAALLFNPYEDENSREVSGFAEQYGAKQALKKYGNFDKQQAKLIEKLYAMFRQGKKLSELIEYCDNLPRPQVI